MPGEINLGRSLESSEIQRGLRELNPDISFDAALNRPSDYQFAFSAADEFVNHRGSVLYKGRHVCSLDRGVVPEKTLYEVVDGLEEIPMSDIERYDETRVMYVEILTSDPFYHEALLKAEKKDDNFVLDGDGRVFKFRAVRFGKVPGRAIRVGWRHTFDMLVAARIPGVDLVSLQEKFGV